ncbi:diaminopimelate epimerase [Pontibacter ummariensis]|uniref:Diaminopimelate epimerase n=1 Tax=Pontibacter ummariensis TaxID=1610492 RepID=A0A239B1S7_9BACT|nr:diaminopimelate epimerase [Pontibacter ummariensis]PRY16235.1 diaminopimelate epimerase [Pontibacter ummariensis]SNS01581.1 diaminopimelate epimerase [Pontibacter ummariensis]
MAISFYKYQGTGNDFVMVDNRKHNFPAEDEALVKSLCDRRTGVGADGLILLQDHPDYDFEMVYYNADGRVGSMCGNGGRCAVRFARQLGVIEDVACFLAADGEHQASVERDLIQLKMNDVKEVEQVGEDYYLNTGSPHYVRFVEDVQALDVYEEGRAVRYNDRFKAVGTNVNFVQRLSENEIYVRTYERGVEDETLSCGTGVTACALVASLKGFNSPVKVKTLGGELEVSFERTEEGGFKHIYLIGPAKLVFTGSIPLQS